MRRGLSQRMLWLVIAYATGWPRLPRSVDSLHRPAELR